MQEPQVAVAQNRKEGRPTRRAAARWGGGQIKWSSIGKEREGGCETQCKANASPGTLRLRVLRAHLLLLIRPLGLLLLLVVLQHQLVLVELVRVLVVQCRVKPGGRRARDVVGRGWGVRLARVGLRPNRDRHGLRVLVYYLWGDELRLHHQLDLLSLLLLLDVDELLGLVVATVLGTIGTASEIIFVLTLFALHHVARLEFEFAAQDDGESIGAAGFLDAWDARAHTPLVHFMTQCVSFALEKAELLRSEDSVPARGVDVANARVDDGGLGGSPDLREVGEQRGQIEEAAIEGLSPLALDSVMGGTAFGRIGAPTWFGRAFDTSGVRGIGGGIGVCALGGGGKGRG